MEADFSGYATKAGIKCTDGRTITPQAFEAMHGKQVPLVWQHGHGSADNVLGHAILEKRSDGVYAYGYFNDAKQGKNARELVQHKDIDSMSIYANSLVESPQKAVLHGVIREVSLVLSGANSGAKIDFVRLEHADGSLSDAFEDEAVIKMGIPLEHSGMEDEEDDEEENEGEDLEHAEARTLRDVYDGLSDEEKDLVNFMVGQALESVTSAEHSDISTEDSEDDDAEENLAHQEGSPTMVRKNVFETGDKTGQPDVIQHTALSHDDVKGILKDAVKGGSLRDAVEGYALAHGITNIETLFPDAKSLSDRPEFNKRRTEWVASVLSETSHSPFSRVKSIVADLTQDEARAKGYIKGHLKREEWFGVVKRVTSPTTVYKKQQLDRDDVIDIVDFDVIAWLKQEMRMMLDEEIARAILIGDGRDVSSEDKIKDPIGAADGIGIRSIVNDHELYATTVYVNVDDANSTFDEVVDSVLDGMEFYKGTGTPDFYTTIANLNRFLKVKDTMGRRIYNTKADVAAALGVRDVITVEPMNDMTDLVGIIVNLSDYNVGTDRGGDVTMFDDFDIDYNRQKYLIETRLSGALVKIKSAIVVRKTAAGNALVAPDAPTFNSATGVVTIPAKTGVVYKDGSGTTLTAGAQTALAAGATMQVQANPAANYYFATNARDQWTYKRPSA